MKQSNVIKALTALSLMSVFVIGGCKKEVVKPTTINTVTVGQSVDSANFLRGFLDGEPVKFEGNAIAYHGYVDPDSLQGQGGSGDDHDAYYQSGSKWVILTGAGLASTNASVEIRSLAVRVFVSPLNANSSNYYNLLGAPIYAFSTHQDPSKGAYVSLRDKNGVLWTSAGDQDGSTLTITSRGANMNSYTVVSGTITCKMYDAEGNVKQLTNAIYTAALGI